jgi:TonB family protein
MFDNLLAWSAQISILAIAATAAAYALRQPRIRLYFWQAILAATLMLPAITPWRQDVVAATPLSAPVVLPAENVMVAVPASTSWGIQQLLMVLAAGSALRLLWVGVGLLRLGRIRRRAQIMQQPPVAFGGTARWYVSDQVSGPVTFGWPRPTILLPIKTCELTPTAQEAIARHELFHVYRRDWLFVMAEELVRCALWFHPAIWFILSRVQLAREQVVDQEVVNATRDRAGYLDALVAVAAQRFQADVAPAPLFLKRRQLAVRVQALLKETTMSASRLAAHVSVAACVAIIGVCAAVWFFPLQSAAQVLPDDPGITVDAGAPLAHRTPVHNAVGTTAVGDVLLELSLNSKGEVADARVLSGPEELRKAALASVLDWHYAADTAPPSLVRATIHFGQRLARVAPPHPPPPGLRTFTAPPPPPPPPPPPESVVVQRIEFRGLSPELQQRVEDRLTVRTGDTLGGDGVRALQDQLTQIDEHLIVHGTYDPQRAHVILFIMLPGTPPPPLPPLPPGVYKIGGGVSAPIPVFKPEPEYTDEARKAKWQGAVLLQVVIDESGVPQSIQVVRPLGLGLDQKAVEAVQKWRFKPGLKDGNPVPTSAVIEVNFRLLQSPQ